MLNFGNILSDLQAAIAVVSARRRALTPLLVAVWGRIGRMRVRLERLVAMWREAISQSHGSRVIIKRLSRRMGRRVPGSGAAGRAYSSPTMPYAAALSSARGDPQAVPARARGGGGREKSTQFQGD
jgi:hypothetical protein